MIDDFDPDGAAAGDSGLFGLPHGVERAAVVVVPVPWEVTTSYRRGTAAAPARVLVASHQVDLFDPEMPDAWRAGIAMDPIDAAILDANDRACALALPVIDAGGPGDDPEMLGRVAEVDAASAALDAWLGARIGAIFDRGAIPAVLGGDHSVPFAAMREAIRRFPGLGVLHLDAHADLRVAYLGFHGSHASILHRVLDEGGLQGPLVQVAIRDVARAEWDRARTDARIHPYPWAEIARGLLSGASFDALARPMIEALPRDVWITVDIDGLDPAFCPSTGTPVPGGLSWDQTVHLLRLLRESGRRVVGFDLVEVGDAEWDAIVGARLLYQLACTAITTR